MPFVNGVWQSEVDPAPGSIPPGNPADLALKRETMAIPASDPRMVEANSRALGALELRRSAELRARTEANLLRQASVNDPEFNNPNPMARGPTSARNPNYLGNERPAGQVYVQVPDVVTRTESGGVVRTPGQQPAQQPTAEEVAARRAMLAETIRREKEANARQAQVNKVNSDATRLRVRLMAAGATREGIDVAVNVAKGQPVDLKSYETVKDLANMDVSKWSASSNQVKGVESARALLTKIDTGVKMGVQAVVQKLAGQAFTDPATYAEAVNQAVNGDGSAVAPAMRSLVVSQLTRNPPPELAASAEERRKIAVRQDMEQAQKDAISRDRWLQSKRDQRDANGQPVYSEADVQTIAEKADAEPDSFWARERDSFRVKDQEPGNEAGKQAKQAAQSAFMAGTVDLTNRDQRAIVAEAMGEPVVSAVTTDVQLPSDPGMARVQEGTVDDAVRLATQRIVQGQDATLEAAVSNAMGHERVQAGIEEADEQGQAFIRARIAQGVQASLKAQIARQGAEALRQTEQQDATLTGALNSIVVPGADQTEAWTGMIGKDEQAIMARLETESPFDIAASKVMAGLDARFANDDQRRRVETALSRYAAAREGQDGITISEAEQRRFGPIFSKVAQLAEGMQAGLQTYLAKQADVDVLAREAQAKQMAEKAVAYTGPVPFDRFMAIGGDMVKDTTGSYVPFWSREDAYAYENMMRTASPAKRQAYLRGLGQFEGAYGFPAQASSYATSGRQMQQIVKGWSSGNVNMVTATMPSDSVADYNAWLAEKVTPGGDWSEKVAPVDSKGNRKGPNQIDLPETLKVRTPDGGSMLSPEVREQLALAVDKDTPQADRAVHLAAAYAMARVQKEADLNVKATGIVYGTGAMQREDAAAYQYMGLMDALGMVGPDSPTERPAAALAKVTRKLNSLSESDKDEFRQTYLAVYRSNMERLEELAGGKVSGNPAVNAKGLLNEFGAIHANLSEGDRQDLEALRTFKHDVETALGIVAESPIGNPAGQFAAVFGG